MLNLSRFSAVVLVAAALAGGTACSTLRSVVSESSSSSSKAKPRQKTDKQIAACEKMCSVAGDVDGKEGAVDDCKKECRD